MATNAPNPDRAALRQCLLSARREWSTTAAASSAYPQIQARILTVLTQLEPGCLGIYWPMQGEFNPMDVARAAQLQWTCQLALPYARKSPAAMEFRMWDGQPLSDKDECGIPSPKTPKCVPDVMLVPCVGFTPQGWRLGYGGGYFDRFMAAHPEVTAIGISWDIGQIGPDAFEPGLHDQPLMAVITESNIFTP
ncbi:MAG: 5-formyltetrahydrofolate cyclo-ligase [Aquabacterium sp.]